MENKFKKRIEVREQDFIRQLFGSFDENLKIINQFLKIDIVQRNGDILIIGDNKSVLLGEKLIEQLMELVKKGENLTEQNITYAISLLLEGEQEKIQSLAVDVIFVTDKNKPIKPKNYRAKRYIEQIHLRI